MTEVSSTFEASSVTWGGNNREVKVKSVTLGE